MSLRHAVLGLLANGPASGYDLLKSFELSLSNVWSATQSQLYGELGKLDAAGLIVVASEGPRGRKEYAITDEGRAELRHWLLEVEPTRVRRSDMLLRVFFLNQVTPAEAEGYLDGQEKHAQAYHDHLLALEGQIPWDDTALSVYGRIAMEWGIRFSRASIEWSAWAKERLRDAALPEGEWAKERLREAGLEEKS
ncbi:PadR family transcriptional regulator [Actinorhabdospora filicis]|uniref:PadR family transcriptional regulator n=1 Tax=Actinorhabdospora filicis TaxID=1785913 RepID=A0A9W6SKI7_9ACTN|nr:PadR family transcriptional regulator [Actinorhabdospora filicis]GLZ77668.1 PadR family transcriptional regulator [Actinorhabdospora filicis]